MTANWKAEAILEQAIVHVRARDYDRALAILVQAIEEDPNMVESWVLRGNILMAQEHFFDALLHFDRAIAVRPEAGDAWNNRSEALANMGRWEESEASYRKSLSIRDNREPHLGLANLLCTTMRLEEAAAEYRKVVELDPMDHEAHFNMGVTLLGLGRWDEGFRAYYHRHHTEVFPPRARTAFTEWRGEDLNGKSILLYPEQGYGDEIMAARFVFSIREKYPNTQIILEARAPFTRLAKTLNVGGPYWEVFTRGDADYLLDVDYSCIDYSCSVMDVPWLLGMGPGDVPRLQKYLTAGRWHDTFDNITQIIGRGFNVGLCWGSGKHLSAAIGARQMKSIPIHKLAGLAMPGVNLISLQKPAEPTPPEMGVHDWTDELHDLADTAALIASLDLVITVDTAVAHLAGALGVPVWNFVRFSGYWPWMSRESLYETSAVEGHTDLDQYSLWYPSMRLLRQTALNDWSEPIATAVRDLQALVAQREAAE